MNVSAIHEARTTRHRWRRYAVATVSLLVVTIAILFAWGTRDSGYADRFEERVRVEVPLGSSQPHIDTWLRHTTKYFPTKLDRVSMGGFQGHSLAELAGVSDSDVGSVIRTTIPRQDWIADHLWVCFFLNHEDKCIGYYFLTFHELAGMEAAHQLAMR